MTSDSRASELSRRELFKAGLAASAIHVGGSASPAAEQARQPASAKHLEITNITRTTVKVPFREVPARNMAREIPHWEYSEIVEVELRCGAVGIGETLLYYTWGATTDQDVARARGQNAAGLMWDDSLGAGLQMALFDAVARAGEVPIHALLGRKVFDKTPLSWWNIDTSPEDMALECQAALRKGYMAYKTKGRPWIDLWQQVEQSCAVVPPEFKIDMDFNDTLLDAERAIPILKEFERYPQIGIYESPIFQDDIEGNQQIRAATRVEIAHHYGKPAAIVALKNEICDGFVVGSGARKTIESGMVCAMADKPFWLQLVGTGITAAYSLHFGGVLSHAIWPAVNCHQLYTHEMLTEPIQVREGFADVPDRPGLGFELDRDAVARFQVTKPEARPEPERLIETRWPDGRTMYIANDGKVNFMLNASRRGETPFFEQGVTTRLVPDDGSDRWRELYRQAQHGPLMRK
jgi:L-alanine-DL-glutamate epimerase-like enolase superfamily enzyme